MEWHSKGPTRQQQGSATEALAAEYLQQQGLQLITRNFHCRRGELDLVMAEQEWLVFVEVRSRKANALVSPAESISWRKQQRLIAAARYYLHRYNGYNRPCRFDVVCVSTPCTGQPNLHWIRDAFDAS
ncbi:MAG: YraN family protein [Halomonadaceae bacterium]|nr:MAG: YraN family protein [Halomonadaceae bacterium]